MIKGTDDDTEVLMFSSSNVKYMTSYNNFFNFKTNISQEVDRKLKIKLKTGFKINIYMKFFLLL